jgi:hypothetical protein
MDASFDVLVNFFLQKRLRNERVNPVHSSKGENDGGPERYKRIKEYLF